MHDKGLERSALWSLLVPAALGVSCVAYNGNQTLVTTIKPELGSSFTWILPMKSNDRDKNSQI